MIQPGRDAPTRRTFLRLLGAAASGATLPAAGRGAPAHAGPQAAYNQRYRPQFHFTARTGWLNDPNGLVYYQGVYHLFFQFNEKVDGGGAVKSWGHATSTDLVHWRQLPTALQPDRLGNVWSGSAVVDWHNTAQLQSGEAPPIIAIYTAAGKTFSQCLASSNDSGRTLIKFPQNPVIRQISPDNRDPFVFWHAETSRWVMALYLDDGGKGGFLLLGSKNLKHWERLSAIPFPSSQECPNFFPLPVKTKMGTTTHWIFTGANGHYLIGDFDGKHFTPRHGPYAMDTGNNFYASQVYSGLPASQSRTVQITWMRGGQYPHMPFNQQMGFPCELTLRRFPKGLRVCRYPVPEIKRLRVRTHRVRNRALRPARSGPGVGLAMPRLAADLLDIELALALGGATEVMVEVRGVQLTYAPKTGTVSCLGATGTVLAGRQRVTFRLLLDRTSVEVFANGGQVSMSSCFLPPKRRGGLTIAARGGAARVVSLAVHELKSSWTG